MCLVVVGAVVRAEAGASSGASVPGSTALQVQTTSGARQQPGTIRGFVRDQDFDAPLPGAQVTIVETKQQVTTGPQGDFVLDQVAPGKYTLVFSKDGYARQVKADVVVGAGQLTDVDAELAGEFSDMDEFVVQDILEAAAGSESALLKLRFETPALMDSIGSDLMSRAGASDAASALRLVAGASVQNGKYAVVRGLPDRYVSSQMNGVRLPTADEDKRAVELDQFPSAVIESIQVSKTFTPDQQGDASGGAVNLRLKGVPDQSVAEFKSQLGANSQVSGRNDFLSYDGGGLDFWGRNHGRKIQPDGTDWEGSAGVSTIEAPIDSKWTLTLGGRENVADGVTLGGLLNFFYERDSSYFDNGVDDSYWVETPGAAMTPTTSQGAPSLGNFKTSLFDVTQGTQSVQWGLLSTVGLKGAHHSISLTGLYTRRADDKATLAIDTRGKEYFFPGYDPTDPTTDGGQPNNIDAAPYLRLETLEYTERSTGTLQLAGKHEFPIAAADDEAPFHFHAPQLEWSLSKSFADLDQPDKRQFGAFWQAPWFNSGSGTIQPPQWQPFRPSENINLGNFQRIFKSIEEESQELTLDLRWPFQRWGTSDGYLKAGIFDDELERAFNQDTFSNSQDFVGSYSSDFDQPWSDVFPSENHLMNPSTYDVDYRGDQGISALYAMADVPIVPKVHVIGGVRFESTTLSIVNDPEPDATWFMPGQIVPSPLTPGVADVDFEQDDVLPALSVEYKPVERVTLRAAYSQTVARQTFKELTPILQQEFLGGPVFIGNPDLQMSAIENYDLRVDYVPYDESLVSLSWFQKDITDPIEYVQRVATFEFTTPVNYPQGELNGVEFEVRQGLGRFWKPLEGLSVGFNGTLINSRVELPRSEILTFEDSDIQAPMTVRDMTNAPAYLWNLYFTYDIAETATRLGLFYTVQGDTLVAGAGTSSDNFVPNVYALEYETLNLSLAQKLGKFLELQFQAKNLTNPDIEEVYRSSYIGDDVRKTSYSKGVDYSVALSLNLSF